MGCCGGLVVTVLDFYSDEPDSNVPEVYNGFAILLKTHDQIRTVDR